MILEVRFYLSDAPMAIKGANLEVEEGMSIPQLIDKCLEIDNCGFQRSDLESSVFFVDKKFVEKDYCLKGSEKSLYFLNTIIGG